MPLLNIEKRIFEINSEEEFQNLALDIFQYQANYNLVYKDWIQHLKMDSRKIESLHEIPFLPIEFFKNHSIVCGDISHNTMCFTSSGSTSATVSKHFVKDESLYEKSFTTCFEKFYGDISQYCILALLPNYLQRKGSSLVYMVKRLIEKSENAVSGFYLDNLSELKQTIEHLKNTNQKVILIGVTYALLDLIELNIQLSENFIVMETGGMKGKRKEMVKEELHEVLKNGFSVNSIHSEYGMTELLSQAYSKGNNCFEAPAWMKFKIRELNNPFQYLELEKSGGMNVIDLANIHSCSFIATQDLGKINSNNQLEVLGRIDHSDLRGCNLML